MAAPEEGQLGLRFVGAAEPKSWPNRHHLHLTSTSADDFQATIDRVVALGGAHIDVGQQPDEPHVVLADPEGNELCVIPPDNNFLAGTGQVGELSCDGSRAVGCWSEALGWPLVWDEDEETAIQSPAGGTKVSWGGPPRQPLHGSRDRLRLDVVADDPEAEAERLVGLGVTRVDERQFQDPDGNDFGLRSAVAAPRPSSSFARSSSVRGTASSSSQLPSSPRRARGARSARPVGVP